jgi:hypothetical protein
MGVLQKQYIKDEKGNPVGIFLSIEEYQALIEQIEELEDIIAYDKAKAEPSDPMSYEDFVKELENTAQ